MQIDFSSSYVDSIASLVSSNIGHEIVYDCGDLVEHGGFFEELEYARYKELFPNSIPVPGNHDNYDGLNFYTWANNVDTYRDGVHIVGFDSSLRQDQIQINWLTNTIDDGNDVLTILYIHHPLYSDNERNGGTSTAIKEAFEPMLIQANVNLVVAGHGHAYERHEANGIIYLVIGGAGAPLDNVGTSETQITSSSEHHWLEIENIGAVLHCTVFGTNGNVVDSFSIHPTVANEYLSWSDVKKLYR